MRNRCGKLFGHLIALRLVSRKTEVSRCRCRGIEGDTDVGWTFLFQNGEQRIDKSVKRGGIDAFGITNGILDEGEMRPVNQGHAVEQEKAFHVASLGGRVAGVQRM